MDTVNLSRVKEAAVRLNGKVWTGRRHGDIILAMIKAGNTERVMPEHQGFVTEDGEFLTRAEAYDRAVACGQIRDDGGERRLLSEMLY